MAGLAEAILDGSDVWLGLAAPAEEASLSPSHAATGVLELRDGRAIPIQFEFKGGPVLCYALPLTLQPGFLFYL